jgi:hypothetical protein
LFPEQRRSEFFLSQIAIHSVVAEGVEVVSQVSKGVVERTAEEIGAVIEFGEPHGAGVR